jgi:ABC-2 type transport system ATP-binding protein
VRNGSPSLRCSAAVSPGRLRALIFRSARSPVMTSRGVPNANAIEIEGLRVRRSGKPVLDGLTLDVVAGSVTGLLGPSGSGKSTLIRSIVGVQIVESGEVTVLGRPAGSADLRARVGYVTQAPSVYGDLTVRENLDYFARILGVGRARVLETIGEVDLRGQADQRVDRLSGGQRARVSLATALLNRPELLVLDEPTVGLDPVLRRDLWQLFHRLAGSGSTLLVSSHVMDEADRCDSLLLLRDGALLASVAPDELRARTGERDLEAAFLALAEEAT